MPQALRQSIRLLLKSPGVTIAAVASLALGIGANTTIYALIDAVVLRPLPVSRPDRLVAVASESELTVSYPVYADLAAATRTLSALAAFAPRSGSITAGSESTVGDIYVVSGNYFDVLGVGAALGRAITPGDDRAGSEPVVVLSSAFWRQSLGGDPSAVGRRVLINGNPFTVRGIAPEGFKGTTVGANPCGWIAIASWPRMATGRYLRLDVNSRGWGWLRMVGRMREGVELHQVHRELNAVAVEQQRQFSSVQPDFRVSVTPLHAAATGVRSRAELTRFITMLLVVVVAVLAIACANVSGLLLARGLSRRRELAIRLALGASRRRIATDLLLDAVVLAALGAMFGVLAAMWAIELLRAITLPGGIDMARVDVSVSGPAVALTALASLASALVFGIAPALQATRPDVVGSLKDHPVAGRASRQVLRAGLVALQVTCSLVPLAGTALFARTLQTTLEGDLGFDPRRVAYAATNVALQRYDAPRAAAFYQDVLARVRAHPGVASAAWTRLIPSGDRDTETVEIPGYVSPTGRLPRVGVSVVTSGYFETMGIPIVRGREFSDRDTPGSPGVVVVNQAAAAEFWRGDAVGRQFSIQDLDVTVIGIARDVPAEPGATPQPFVYGHALQTRGLVGPAFLVARAKADPAHIVPVLREAIRAAGSTVPILQARTLAEQLLDLLGPQRSAASLLGLLSVIALVLSAAGIYAMVAFWVTQRTREFGVRMALGASAASLRGLALRHVTWAVALGMAAGVPLAITLGAASRSLLFGLSPMDPLAIGGAMALLFGTAAIASYVPARRASRTSPLEALKGSDP